MKILKIITVKEAVDRLRQAGMNANEVRLRAGIEQGVYPWGVCIQMNSCRVFEVYDVLLERWIDERAEDEQA